MKIGFLVKEGVCVCVCVCVTGKSFAFPSWILIHNPWVVRLKSTLGILMWFVVSTVIAYHIGILDQNPMLGTLNFSLCVCVCVCVCV